MTHASAHGLPPHPTHPTQVHLWQILVDGFGYGPFAQGHGLRILHTLFGHELRCDIVRCGEVLKYGTAGYWTVRQDEKTSSTLQRLAG